MSVDKERLLHLLNKNKISEKEYKLLVAALDKKPSCIQRLFSLLINPFQRIAGMNALITGLFIMLGMSFLGVIAKVYFPSAINIINMAMVKSPKVPLSLFLLIYQNIIGWLILSGCFMLAILCYKQKGVRIVDVFGMTALAHLPGLIIVAILCFINIDFGKDVPIHFSLTVSLFAAIMIIGAAWQLTLYFFALKESSGLTGKNLWISFIASLVIAASLSAPLTMIFL